MKSSKSLINNSDSHSTLLKLPAKRANSSHQNRLAIESYGQVYTNKLSHNDTEADLGNMMG